MSGRAVGSILTKERLQELGRNEGLTMGTLGAWMSAQSKAQWESCGKRCTLETVVSAWV